MSARTKCSVCFLSCLVDQKKEADIHKFAVGLAVDPGGVVGPEDGEQAGFLGSIIGEHLIFCPVRPGD